MSFSNRTLLEFPCNGETIPWTIRRLPNRPFPEQRGLNWVITCQHPIFTNVFGRSSFVTDSLRNIVEVGKETNKNFFDLLQQSFMHYSFEID